MNDSNSNTSGSPIFVNGSNQSMDHVLFASIATTQAPLSIGSSASYGLFTNFKSQLNPTGCSGAACYYTDASGGTNVVKGWIGPSGQNITNFLCPAYETAVVSGSGTYNTPTCNGTLASTLNFEGVAGAGGGAGSGTSPGAAVAGTNSTFGSFTMDGGGAGTTIQAAGAGGSASGCTIDLPGGDGGEGSSATSMFGGVGGASAYGGQGYAGGINLAGGAAKVSTGSGGGGAGDLGTPNTGSGGGAGGACKAIIASPAASYLYSVGAGGAGGAAGTSGQAGGAGANGFERIIATWTGVNGP